MAGLHKQAGQALALGLCLLAAASLMLLALFGIGRVADHRIQLSNAADAAAYSAALVQARTLNMQAYINIAQVGHQVAMAHLVTFHSWATFAQHEAQQSLTGNPPGYVIAMMFGPDHGSAYTAIARHGMGGLQATQQRLQNAYSDHSRIVHDVLYQTSKHLHAQNRLTAEHAVHELLEASFPDWQINKTDFPALPPKTEEPDSSALFKRLTALHPGPYQLNWSLHWRRTEPAEQFYKPTGPYRALIDKAARLYAYLQPRNYKKKNNWVVDAECPWLRHELRRRGQTSLNAEGVWQSMDTQSYHALRSNRWIGCYHREYPMGWAWIPGSSALLPDDVVYAEDPPQNFSQQNFWRWVQQSTQWGLNLDDQNPLANSYAVASSSRWQGGGLPLFADIRSGDQTFKSLQLDVRLQIPDFQGLTLRAASAAEAFYRRRAIRLVASAEADNLWRPFWQSRLIQFDHDYEIK